MAELSRAEVPPVLPVAAAHRDQMVAIVQAAVPLEACGILAGDGQRSRRVIQIRNEFASPTRYRMAPEELVQTFADLDRDGLSILAFFHSHPNSAPIPSPTDLESYYYPEVPMIIIGRSGSEWDLRAYLLQEDRFSELSLVIL